MPQSKISMKSTVLDLELENVEVTVGPEIMRVGHLKVSLDVADLLRVQLPELMKGDTMGVMLQAVGERKIPVIKVIRALTDLGLKEAKHASENLPYFMKATEIQGLDKTLMDRAKKAATDLRAVGATAEIMRGTERIPTVLDRFREMLVEILEQRGQVSKSFADE